MPDLAHANDIVLLSNNSREMQHLMSAHISGEQCQAVLLHSELLEGIDKFKYLDSMFMAKFIDFTAQAKLTRFESALASALRTLPYF